MKRSNRFVSGRVAACAVAVATSALLATGGAQGAIVNFAATIDGPQVPTGSPGLWMGTFVMDTVANTLSVSVVDVGPPLLGPEIASHIHGFAPPGMPAGILFGLPLGSPKIALWNFTEPQEPSIIAGLTYVNIHTTVFPGGEIRGQILRVPSCGDGIVDGGEQCDDGNNANGDCCDSSCQFEASGGACSGAGLCNPSGECDGAGACVATPRGNCRGSLKSIVILKDNATDDAKDKLIYKWIKGEATAQSDFGTPAGTTNYALCLYAGTAQALIAEADVAADSVKWTPISTKGYKYKDKSGTSDSIQKVVLKGGAADKAKALVKGKGTDLPDPTLGNMPLPVIAELVNSSNNICFGSTFDTGDVIKDDVKQFKAKVK